MAQRHQRGWLKKETRSNGETWVLFYRTIRKSDGKRVKNKIAIGLVRDFPDERSARAEVERLHLQLNRVDLRGGVTFADLALHYADHELVERTVSRLSWKWRKRSSVKITERTYEEGTEAFHSRRKSSHLEAASCGQNTRLGAV